MGAACSCLATGGAAVEVKCASLSRGVKYADEVNDFSKHDNQLNIRIDFTSDSPTEMAVVTWKAIKVAGGKYKDGQTLFVEEIPLKTASVTSSYHRSTARRAWPVGLYQVLVHVQLNDDSFKAGREPLSEGAGPVDACEVSGGLRACLTPATWRSFTVHPPQPPLSLILINLSSLR